MVEGDRFHLRVHAEEGSGDGGLRTFQAPCAVKNKSASVFKGILQDFSKANGALRNRFVYKWALLALLQEDADAVRAGLHVVKVLEKEVHVQRQRERLR